LLILLTYVYNDARFRKHKIDFVLVKRSTFAQTHQIVKLENYRRRSSAGLKYFVSNASAKRPIQLQRGLAAL
jgi:hypothetical protein